VEGWKVFVKPKKITLRTGYTVTGYSLDFSYPDSQFYFSIL